MYPKGIWMRPFIEQWKQYARQLKTETYALYLAYRDPRVPLLARLFAGCVVAYAFSPIDLIPDFIPILGYLDDLILVPLGIKLALAMIPEDVLRESREKAQEIMRQGKPINKAAAVIIVLTWLALAALGVFFIMRVFNR